MKHKYLIAALIMILAIGGFIFLRSKKDSTSKPEATAVKKESGHEEGGEDEHGHKEEAEGSIEMDDEKIALSKIKIDTVIQGKVAVQKVFTGEIKLNEDRLARVIPRFSGVVRNVSASVGKSVKQGENLMLIESNESLTTYEVKSPISGVIIEKNVVVGAKADTDSEAFLVADLNTVWVEINVYANDLPYIKKGQEVAIISQGNEKSSNATISYLGPIINGQSRTATARVVLDNKSGEWLPGMFISASVSSGQDEDGVVVPDGAIQTIEGKPTVFVKTEHGFRSQVIGKGKSDGKNVQVTSGIKAGDVIATENSFVLKAELGKGEAEHSHD